MKKIQIALVSKEALPVYYMINELMPDIVYLLATKESLNVMNNIKNVVKQHEMECEGRIVLANDMAECLHTCEHIHAENGIDCEYTYNLTCGTKLMAIGALLCAQTHHARMVYTETKTYIDLGSLEHKSITRFLDTETIIALQGQSIKERMVYAPKALWTECAEEVRTFIKSHKKAYSTLSEYYKKKKAIPSTFKTGNLTYTNLNGEITIEENDVEVFSSDYPKAFHMLFEGQWWEVLVADAVYHWADNEHEVWTNVKFNPQHDVRSNNDKNEIDVLVNIDNILLFIECKSGKFDQNNIYKLKCVRETYGSYKSKGIIVSFYKDRNKLPDLNEKAKEENVEIGCFNDGLSKLPSFLDKIINSKKA